MLCAKFGWNWPSGSEEDFHNTSMYFRYFIIISSWKRTEPFMWKNLNPLYSRMLCAKFGWNWLSGSGEENKNLKSLETDGHSDRQTTDNRWSEKLTWAFSSGELKNSKYVCYISIFFKAHISWNTLKILNYIYPLIF